MPGDDPLRPASSRPPPPCLALALAVAGAPAPHATAESVAAIAIALGVLVLGETITATGLAGIALVLAGVALTRRRTKPATDEPSVG